MLREEEIKEVEHWFSEYVFGFMRNDLERGIDSGLNYLVALGLGTYTEILGSLITGKERPFNKNFSAFWNRMGPEYTRFGAKKAYSLIRSGLVHYYFVRADKKGKGIAGVARRGEAPIILDENKRIKWIVVKKWFEDFFKTAEKLRNEIISSREQYTTWLKAKKKLMGEKI